MSNVKRFCSPTGEMREAVGDAQLGWRYVRECDYDAQSAYAVTLREALNSLMNHVALLESEGGSAHDVVMSEGWERARAAHDDQRQGADSPASQVSDPSTGASSAHGVTTPADSAPSDVRSEVAQSAPATNVALTGTFVDGYAVIGHQCSGAACGSARNCAKAGKCLLTGAQATPPIILGPHRWYATAADNQSCYRCGKARHDEVHALYGSHPPAIENQMRPLTAEEMSNFEIEVERMFREYTSGLSFSEKKHGPDEVLTLVVGNMRRLWWDVMRGKIKRPEIRQLP